MTDYTYNDGGRHAALIETNDDIKFFGTARDCVARSLAIVTGRPYTEIWSRLADINKIHGGRHSANHGIKTSTDTFNKYADELGLMWVQPVQDVFKKMQFPNGRIVVGMHGHYTALIDGVINDAHNPTPAGKAWVFGYWIAKPVPSAMFNVCNITTGLPLNRAPLNHSQAETMARLMLLNYKIQTNIKPI